MTALVDEAAQAVKAALAPAEYRALIMMGGYGRGEGGVENVDGQERPHNNLDFLLVAETARPIKLLALRRRLIEAFSPVMRKHGIEIDLSVVSRWKLRFSPSLIIWYDTRFGHKTILGDADYWPSLTQFRLDRIPPRDALRLLVNRGTLLVINEHILKHENGGQLHRRRITRNIMKAIIGYGDALLFFLGGYHWSYVERKRRMEERKDISPAFRQLYDEAAEFRFQPDYGRYSSMNLSSWMAELRSQLEPIHRLCEEDRLGVKRLTWQGYPVRALEQALLDEPLSVRSWARKVLNLSHSAPCPLEFGVRAKLGSRLLGVSGRYPLVFPLVAYHIGDTKYREFAASTLNASDSSDESLREAYLRLWCEQVDINARSSLRMWQVPVSGVAEYEHSCRTKPLDKEYRQDDGRPR